MGSARVGDSDVVDAAGKYGSARHFDKNFKGPIRNRGCTDVICLVLFLAFFAGWITVGYLAMTWGDPMKLLYPSDSKGEICGKASNEKKPELLFFDITKCFRPDTVVELSCGTRQVCIESCPEENILFDSDELKQKMKPFCGDDFTDELDYESLIKKQICPRWILKSKAILGRCVPSLTKEEVPSHLTWDKLEKGVKGLAGLMNVREYGEKIFSDLVNSWWLILLGVLLAGVVALVWIILMRFVAAWMVWISLLLVTGLLVTSCVFCGFKYLETSAETGDGDDLASVGFTTNIDAYLRLSATWMIFLVLSAVILLIILLMVIFLRTRIRIAIELIEEGSHAVSDMISTLFFPIVPFVWQAAVLAWFGLVAAYLASSGEQIFKVDGCPEAGCNLGNVTLKDKEECIPQQFSSQCIGCPEDATCSFFKYGPSSTATYFQLYNIFGLLWFMFFLSALDQMVLAGAFASWYWTLDKRKVPRLPLLSSLWRALFYHLGTLAFGSLIIAIIRMIRLMLQYVEKKLKEYHQENPLVKVCLCCCKCCFWCLESFMKFINKNAYIMTAIYGKNFCWSAKESFNLLMRNILRVIVLDKVTDFLLFVGKLVIVSFVGVLSFYLFSGRLSTGLQKELPELNYYFLPVILITLGAFFIADVFFEVYEMAVDTLFLCFLEDIERNDGSMEKPYFMSRDMRKILGYMEKHGER